MATSSLPPSPAFACSMCQMFSYSSAFYSNIGICNKCSLFGVLEAKLSELESRLHTIENHLIASHVPLPGVEPPSIANPVNCYPSMQPGLQAGWVTVRKRRHSPKVKPVVNHQPVHVSNRFSQLSNTSAEEKNPGN